MSGFQLVVWAVVPPLVLLVYYYRHVAVAPPLPKLLLLFVIGALSGFVALALEWGFEHLTSWVVNWEQITRSLPGVALRQLVEVGPIEEGSKLSGFVLISWYLFRWKRSAVGRYRSLARSRRAHALALRPSSVFLSTTSVALGFAAEENWVYLSNGTASIFDRLIGTPVHALFSAPWGYALGVVIGSTFHSSGNRSVVARAWLNAVICHALVNVLSSAWRYSQPLHFLSYGLFPFLLWMIWRMEGLLRRSQTKPPITLISGYTRIHRYWQRGLALFALALGGNAIFGIFLLARSLTPLSHPVMFSPDLWWFIVSRFVLNLIPGLIAWGIYRYLRHAAQRQI